ncbi:MULTISPECIES: GIY-YIG nuclease family protein [Rhodomicrobium]|uniref:GIY-YIG nuclease family protein n=1 Tax=Rhodomicrobium TaxID=1068 RepID=UPI000B4B33B8|nr:MULTISPECIES: GIY-YIG nuclease family protein [Rhodomicrobium]
MGKAPCYVYILASRLGGTLYVGVTSNLTARVYQHKQGAVDGFAKRYRVDRLVYFESVDDLDAAVLREMQIKKWDRSWKVRLIEEENPNWVDLYPEIATP